MLGKFLNLGKLYFITLSFKVQIFPISSSLIFLSTPYDEQSLDFLTQLGVPAFKISSSDATNHLFLESVLKKRKPLLLSTGLTSIKHVDLTVKLVDKFKMKKKLVLFQFIKKHIL